jgi:hypothetical protein
VTKVGVHTFREAVLTQMGEEGCAEPRRGCSGTPNRVADTDNAGREPLLFGVAASADTAWDVRTLTVYAVAMIERLTRQWRRETAEQQAAVAAGTMSPDEAYALTFFPPAFVAAVDAALDVYEQEIASLDAPTDEAVWIAVERVVVALNGVDLAFGQRIDTMTREELSEYIENVLGDTGIDVEALLERRGVDEVAGQWRDW